MNTEIELKRLEEDIKGLKASYPIAANKVKFYVTKSGELTTTGIQEARFKFTPNYGKGKVSFIKLSAVARVSDSDTDTFVQQINEPQDGSGAVVIKIRFEQYSSSTTYVVKLTASGTSPGSFERLA